MYERDYRFMYLSSTAEEGLVGMGWDGKNGGEEEEEIKHKANISAH